MSTSFDFSAALVLQPEVPAMNNRVRVRIEFVDYPEYATAAELYQVDLADAAAKQLVSVQMLGQDYFAQRLYASQEFQLLLGQAVVGSGSIQEVFNEKLRRPEAEEAIRYLNLNTYPPDILLAIREDFEHLAPLAVRELQLLLAQTPSVRHPRIIRAVLHLAGGSTSHLDDAIETARQDYRDVLLQAEYRRLKNGKLQRVRDFSQAFVRG